MLPVHISLADSRVEDGLSGTTGSVMKYEGSGVVMNSARQLLQQELQVQVTCIPFPAELHATASITFAATMDFP